MFINYAHRGASAYAPENTMSAFRLGIKLGANGIETDIRLTKDGIPVLFHDADLKRLTGEDLKISELTLTQLRDYRIYSPDRSSFDYIPSLTEFLQFAKDKDVTLALELKDNGIEERVLNAVKEYSLSDRTYITSFDINHLTKIKELDRNQKTGLLTERTDSEIIKALKSIGSEQICPKASVLNPETVKVLHSEGFDVRAWGVRDEETMRRALECGVDGMTLNFPDKLQINVTG